MGEKNRMKKVVFFTDEKKIKDALEIFNIRSFSGEKVPFKLHMGEKGNKYFSRPDFVKKVIKSLQSYDIKPFLFDTTVAYQGERHTVEGYLKLAVENGFSIDKIGCNVVIDDKGITYKIEGREYKVSEHIYNSKFLFSFTHVKGHVATGMGGAIKNFGMGGVTKETKIRMHHGSRPIFTKDKCTYCGICAEVCPFGAIKIVNNSWIHNMNSCFGCGVCVENCESTGLSHKDLEIQYALACAAKACVQDKNVIYINDVNRITKSCDCDPLAGPIICPDIGYLVSDDPVAIDKASLELINNIKPNIFLKENKINPLKQIDFAENIGLGSSSYDIIDI